MKIDFRDPDQLTCNVPTFKQEGDYIPIDCGHYDHLEIWAMRKTPIQIHYDLDQQIQVILKSKIQDIQTKEGIEYLTILRGQTIRLDQIHSIQTL